MRYKKVLILVLSMVLIVCLVAISASSVLENREEGAVKKVPKKGRLQTHFTVGMQSFL